MPTQIESSLQMQPAVDAAEPNGLTTPSHSVTHRAGKRGAMRAFKRNLVPVLILIFLICLGVVGWLIHSNQRAERESGLQERHTREVIQQLGDLMSSLKDAETGQRGFIITGKPDYLDPYRASLLDIASALDSLRRLTADDPEHQKRLDAITPLVTAKLADLRQTIALREAQGLLAASAAVATRSGKKSMDEIRALVNQAHLAESQRLKQRVATYEADNRKMTQSVTLGSALTGATLLLLFMRLRWALASRRRAHMLVSKQAAEMATLYASAPVGLFFYDKDLRYVRVNPTMADLNGLPTEQHIGRTLRELLTPELADKVEPQVRRVMDTRQPLLDCEVYGATTPRASEQQRHWLISYHPVFAEDGTIMGVQGAVQDITDRKHAEKALRASEERYRGLFNSIDEGFCVIEIIDNDEGQAVDYRYLEVNPAFKKQTGILDPVGKRMREISPDHEAHYVETFSQVLETGVPVRFLSESKMIGGYYDVYAARIEETESRKVAIVFNNITERKKAEQALTENAALFATLIEQSPGGVYVVDAQFRLQQVNTQAQPVFATVYPLIGRDFAEVMEAVWGPEIGGQCTAIFRHTLATGERYKSDRFSAQRHDIGEEQAYEWETQRLTLADGQYGVVCYFVNVTERELMAKTLQQAHDGLEQRVQARTADLSRINADLMAEIAAKELLRESEERLLTVAENLSEGLVITTMEGEFIHWNRASLDMHGFASMAECMGYLVDLTTLVEVKTLAGAVLPLDEWPMSRALRGEIVSNCEVRLRRTDTGMERILNCGGKSVQDSAGKQCAFLTVTDITERKKAEAELHELNNSLERRVLERTEALADLDHRKDEFLAMLSHELRNPMAALSSAVQMLQIHKSEDPLLLLGRGIIERQLGRLTNLVDDLLEISRITSGRIQLRPEPVAISGILDRALETANPLITQRRHTVTVSVPPEPLCLHADTARLEQVVVNLLNNAAKYTDLGGRIWLIVVREGDAAVVRVRDSGIGITPELLPNIFDLFTQAERSLDRSEGGLGIGLCLVQRLVELHGGSVTAHSVLGQGSEFVVRLPLLLAPLPALPIFSAPYSDSDSPPKQKPTGCRVLVVDDNVDAALALARVLEMTGHEIKLAYDGPTGLQAALDYRPEVLLLDIGLPGLTGHEVAQRIRKDPALKNIVLVALTGYGHDSDRQRVQEAGFDHHLVKPASFSQINDILQRVSKRRT